MLVYMHRVITGAMNLDNFLRIPKLLGSLREIDLLFSSSLFIHRGILAASILFRTYLVQ